MIVREVGARTFLATGRAVSAQGPARNGWLSLGRGNGLGSGMVVACPV